MNLEEIEARLVVAAGTGVEAEAAFDELKDEVRPETIKMLTAFGRRAWTNTAFGVTPARARMLSTMLEMGGVDLRGVDIMAASADVDAGVMPIPQGTLYPTLERMRRAGWLVKSDRSRWTVTDEGSSRLRDWAREAGDHDATTDPLEGRCGDAAGA